MQNILDYLKELAQQPEMAERFKRKDLRAEVLREASLSSEDKELLLKDDLTHLRQHLGELSAEAPLIYCYDRILLVHCYDH